MTTKERLHKLIDSLPDTPETELRLEAAEDELQQPIESLGPEGGLSDDDAMLVGHEAAIERLRADPVAWASWQAEIAELDGTLSDGLGGL